MILSNTRLCFIYLKVCIWNWWVKSNKTIPRVIFMKTSVSNHGANVTLLNNSGTGTTRTQPLPLIRRLSWVCLPAEPQETERSGCTTRRNPQLLDGSTRLCGRLKPPGEGDLHPPVRNNKGLLQQGKEIKNGERNNDFLIMVLPNHSWSTLKILLPLSTQSCRSYQWVSHCREPLGKLLNTSLQIGQNLAFLPPQPESSTVWTEREFPSLTCKPNTS